MPQTINVLDETTINKIAAGEVIDRPASIVKELIENCIDAQATEIKITIENGGKTLIKITDNGIGISPEDLPLTPIRHATSKINKMEDLYTANSFGFRGEALASICHVAKLEIISNFDSKTALKITANDNIITKPIPDNHPQGTTVTIKDLFHHIPVRQKFLKSNATESSYISTIIHQFAIMNPAISFIYINQSQESLNTRGITDQEQLLIKIMGRDLKQHLIKLDTQIGDVYIKGHISDPTLTFSNRNKQILSVNNRLIKNAAIQKAIQQSYQDLIPNNRFPLIALDISIPPLLIDVNIHPQKQDIKCLNTSTLFDSIKKIIYYALEGQQKENTKDLNRLLNTSNALPNLDYSVNQFSNTTSKDNNQNYERETRKMPSTESLNTLFEIPNRPTSSIEYIQMFETYIVLKTNNNLWILDQHAVHERILYEKIKKSQNNTEKQTVLISEIIELPRDLALIYKEKQSLLKQLGIGTEEFGANQILINELSITFKDLNLKELILDLLTELKDRHTDTSELLLKQKDSLQMAACKAAIKAGKKMTIPETEQLLHDFIDSPSNFTCPHGRPLFIKWNKNDLEKLFNRR